jgi:hypothetical protein
MFDERVVPKFATTGDTEAHKGNANWDIAVFYCVLSGEIRTLLMSGAMRSETPAW